VWVSACDVWLHVGWIAALAAPLSGICWGLRPHGCTALHFVCVEVVGCEFKLSCCGSKGSCQGWYSLRCVPVSQQGMVSMCRRSFCKFACSQFWREKVWPWCGSTCY
jgi:hypothetical protein